MAFRIRNTGRHLLRLDLRNGESVSLRPGESSRPLREELLYANPYLVDWEARGLVTREAVSMTEVREHERSGAASAAGRAAPRGGAPAGEGTGRPGATTTDEPRERRTNG